MNSTLINNLNQNQKTNIKTIVDDLIVKGITNTFAHAAVLAITYKESNFNCAASEISYANTSNDRIRSVFSKTKVLNDTDLNKLKADKESFFNFVYNGIIGNGPKDGYLFRGRGFNQLTGRANYQNISRLINKDLTTSPDLLSNPQIASDALIAYFNDRIKRIYPQVNVNMFTTLEQALDVYYDANAGSVGKHLIDVTGGYLKAKGVIQDLYTLVKDYQTTKKLF